MVHKTSIPITPVSRKSFSLEFKRYAVHYIDKAVEKKMASVGRTCDFLCIPHYYYPRCKKTLVKDNDLKSKNKHVAYRIKLSTRKIHLGHPSALEEIRSFLSRFIFELRKQGIQVSNHTVRNHARCMSRQFKEKTLKAKKASISCFVKKMGYSHRIGTHVAQKKHKDSEDDA